MVSSLTESTSALSYAGKATKDTSLRSTFLRIIVFPSLTSVTGMNPTEKERIAPSLTKLSVSFPSDVSEIFAVIFKPFSSSDIFVTTPIISLWSRNSLTLDVRSTAPGANFSLSPPPISIVSLKGTATPETSRVSELDALISKSLVIIFVIFITPF